MPRTAAIGVTLTGAGGSTSRTRRSCRGAAHVRHDDHPAARAKPASLLLNEGDDGRPRLGPQLLLYVPGRDRPEQPVALIYRFRRPQR
jgi:hypothetical protein